MRFCKKCDADTDRYASGDCKQCASLRSAAAYEENKSQRLEKAATYRSGNREKIKQSQANYIANNVELKKARDANYRARQDKDEKKSYHAEYYKANKEKLVAAASAYKASNPDLVKTYRLKNKERLHVRLSKWRAANTERMAKTSAAWAKANPLARRRNEHNRRARIAANGGVLSPGVATRLLILQRGKCACCGKPLGVNYHLDHIMPLSLGGMNVDRNMQLLRQRCNNQKYNKHPIDYMQQKGFLL